MRSFAPFFLSSCPLFQNTFPQPFSMSSFRLLRRTLSPLASSSPVLSGRMLQTSSAPAPAAVETDAVETTVEAGVKSSVSPPLTEWDFFAVRNCFSIKEMFDARVHLGHKEGTLNPNMKPYLVGSRLSSLIIDLDQSHRLMGDALNFTAHIAARRGIILIVNRSRQTGHLAEKLAREVGEYAHIHDFPAATFSNSAAWFGAPTRLPDLVILLSTLNHLFDDHRAVTDSNRLLIPTVGIVDTASDPTLITYPVPGNDDTPCAIEFYCRLFKTAILAGKSYADKLSSSGSSA